MLKYCCVALNVPGISEKARLRARHHFRTPADNDTVYPLGSSRCTLPLAACLFGFPIPTSRPIALPLSLVMSTRFGLFRTSLWCFFSGYSPPLKQVTTALLVLRQHAGCCFL